MHSFLVPSFVALAAAPQDSTGSQQGSYDQRLQSLEKEVATLKAKETPKAGESDLRAFWRDGLKFETSDKSVQLQMGGRFQVDTLSGGPDHGLHDYLVKSGQSPADVEDGAEFRRARLYLQGTVTDLYAFKLQFDFADANKAKEADVWGEIRKIPAVGALRVGQFYEPTGIEQLTSDFDNDFMERSLMNALSPARNLGAVLHNLYYDRIGWWGGAFVDDGSGDTGGAVGDGEHALTARVYGLPWITDGDETVVHVGASGSYRVPIDHKVSISTRPESHLAPKFADTGTISNVDHVELLAGEAFVQKGPVHASAEYMQQKLDVDGKPDATLQGWYLAAGWFLTGERFGYTRSDGIVAAPKILHPFRKDGGRGALELVAKHSQLDLTDAAASGGSTKTSSKVHDTTVGVNWFLNNNFKVAVDGVHSHVDGAGSANLLELWFQVNF
jgi:phosphate-selective porin OprO/OprP